MKKLIALLIIAVFVLALGGCGSSKIGTVDTQKVMQSSGKIKKLQEDMMLKQNDARKKIDELTKKKDTMKDDEFQKQQKAVYDEFSKAQEEADKNFQNALKVAMEKVIKDRGLDAIIYKDAVAGGGVDVSDEVLKTLDGDMPKTDAKATPAISSSVAPATSASGK